MKASELRIGNYVSDIHASDSFYASVNKIHSDRIYYGNFHSNPTDIKPIPLTEEWLVMFGFQHDGEWLILKSFETMFETLNINTKICKATISDGDIYDYKEIHLTDNIKHVHQLQNLYFALTGEELTLSE